MASITTRSPSGRETWLCFQVIEGSIPSLVTDGSVFATRPPSRPDPSLFYGVPMRGDLKPFPTSTPNIDHFIFH